MTADSGRSFAEKATAAWGSAPDWVIALAELADAVGLRTAGKRVGYSASAVSQALANKYAGDVGKVAEKVRGALLGLTVECPVQGEMSRNRCLEWQVKPFAPTSSLRVRMFHACRGDCPNSNLPRRAQPTGGQDGE